jgi:hypothetical protein
MLYSPREIAAPFLGGSDVLASPAKAGALQFRANPRAKSNRGVGMIGDIAGGLLGSVIFLAVPAYFVLQPWAANRLRGGWRAAALAPLVFAIPAVLWSLYAFSQGSNLWPLVFILFTPFGTLYLVILLLISYYRS